MITYKKGDAVKAAINHEIDILVHGCNCHHSMGAGIARQIKKEFPDAFKADKITKKGPDKLGDISVAYQRGATIVNAYTQNFYGRKKCHADYQAIRSCMKKIKELANGQKIGMPKIGAGLAGGDWEIIEKIIEEELVDCDITVYVL